MQYVLSSRAEKELFSRNAQLAIGIPCPADPIAGDLVKWATNILHEKYIDCIRAAERKRVLVRPWSQLIPTNLTEHLGAIRPPDQQWGPGLIAVSVVVVTLARPDLRNPQFFPPLTWAANLYIDGNKYYPDLFKGRSPEKEQQNG